MAKKPKSKRKRAGYVKKYTKKRKGSRKKRGGRGKGSY